MKTILCIGAVAALAAIGAVAKGQEKVAPAPASARAVGGSLWGETLTGGAPAAAPLAGAPSAAAEVILEPAGIDVVDAHWMALTMWGEARGEGEEAMRAVGHVIDNRRRMGADFVTDTVSEAFQFSCWNAGDPNRAAIERALELREGSREHDMWIAARRIAGEILAGRSSDPTGGALFYHTDAVAPRWSRGIAPVRRIGSHLFFRTAARA